MQVLDYQTQPIGLDQPPVLTQTQTVGLDSSGSESPVNEIINSTIDAINQTLHQMVEKAGGNNVAETSSSYHSFEEDWNILYFLRLLFYILVILKIIELVFSKRKKMDIKERVYRKYVFSYAQMIRQFDDQDRNVMNTTLKNTIKNASLDKNQPKMLKKTSTKKVIFHETKNEYIEPVMKRDQEGMEGISRLEMFLSRPVKDEPVEQQVADLVAICQNEFEVIETISEKKEEISKEESEIFIQKEGLCSSITESTVGQSLIGQESIIKEQESSKEKDE